MSKSAQGTGSTSTDEGPGSQELVWRLLKLGWRYRWRSLLVLTQQIGLVIVGLVTLGLTGLGIDYLRFAVDPNVDQPRWPLGIAPPTTWSHFEVAIAVAVAVFAASLLTTWLRYLAVISSALLTQQIVVDLRTAVYEKLQHLSFRFYDARQSGGIINRVAGDVQAVRGFVDGVVIQVLAVILSLTVYLIYMLQVHVWLTLACIATTPLLWIGAVLFSRMVRPEYRRSSELVDDLVLTVSENFQGAAVIKGFNQQEAQIQAFQRKNQALRDQKGTIFRILCFFQPIMGIITQLNMLVVMGYGGLLVIRGEIRLGEGLFVFANLLQQFASQVAQIVNVANTIQSSLTGAQRVFEVLDAPLEITDGSRSQPLARARGEVVFENVGFAYKPELPILEKINFAVTPGECIAVVGATGAGKSTLLSLIPRFYDPTAGRVLLDGVDLRELKVQDLRRNIGIVFQESFLFSNTAAANIAFGHPDATREQIAAAARLAQAEEFVTELPEGYNTVIGEYGCDLSGGQRQRLALARALLLDPPILILDDATSAIDPETEGEILKAMDQAMQGRTTFITAHRLSTLQRADRILVLEKGHITQIGTHEELMQAPGHYRDAALRQSLGDAQFDEPNASVAGRGTA